MVFRSETGQVSGTQVYPLETMRAIAVFLLVSYHAIGSGPTSGLELDYPHPFRIFSDFLIDLRMPFFAFIAGYVYGLRPIMEGQYLSFITGKFRRLYIPCAIAASLFALLASLTGNGSARTLWDFWQIYFFPYAHYWFLQAILLIFVFFGGLDVLLGKRFTLLMLLMSCLAYLFLPFIPGNFMSVNSAVYLLPFFLLGLVFVRNVAWVSAGAPWLIGLSATVVLAASAWNLMILEETGRLSLNRLDLQSLGMGLAVCVLAMLTLPQVARFRALGPYAFTIYLYHIFGTGGAREVMHALGVTGVLPIFLASLICGIGGPVLLHRLADQWSLSRRFVLGKKY